MVNKVEQLYFDEYEELIVIAVCKLEPDSASLITIENLLETALSKTQYLAKILNTLKSLCEHGLLESVESGDRTLYKCTVKTFATLRRTVQRRRNQAR